MVLNPSPTAAPYLQQGAADYEQHDLAAARQAFESALAVQPDLTSAKFNLGVICRDLEENETAESYFRRVVAEGELLAEAHNNLGILASRREAIDEALAGFREAIRLKYQFPLAHFNLATLLLRLEDWPEGWREFEWRWQTPSFTPIQCPQPQWDGEPLDGTLLLHTEQGIGDVFQFARFIPEIRQRCRRVLFVRPDHLDCMFPQSLWADDVRSAGELSLKSFDAILPLLSAPLALKSQPEQLPIAEAYLTPEPRDVKLGPVHVPDARLKVAITWCGSPTHANDAFRSTRLGRFTPLLDVDGVAFYSVQIGEAARAIAELGSRSTRVRDLSDAQRDFADTAAIVRQMDLVITVDTSLLHLAGGMGVPAWGLISRRSDWRWLGHDRTDTAWYPSVRLFRQRRLDDWDELMQRVAVELKQLVNVESGTRKVK